MAVALVLAGSALLSGCDTSESAAPSTPSATQLLSRAGSRIAAPHPGLVTQRDTAGTPTVSAAATNSQTTSLGAGGVTPHPVIGWISSGRVVTLTFDDGPGPFTGRILELLNADHLHATFCQIGQQVGDYPDTEHRIAASDDTFCNHSWDHDEQLPTKPIPVITSEIARTQTAIHQATGRTPAFYRAPVGNWGPTPAFLGLLAHQQLLPLGWAVDSEDWKRPGVPTIVHNVMSQVTPGAVILLHDGGGDRSETLIALPILIDKLRTAGYTITAMPPPNAF